MSYAERRVRDLQKALVVAGFDPGPIDGDFGVKTANALWASHAADRLPPDDVLSGARDALECVSYLTIGGERVPVPQPLWIRPYRLGELPHRKRTLPVVQIILHHDAAQSAESCYKVLEARELSSHGAFRADGIFLQYLDPAVAVAFHAAGHVQIASGAVVPAGFNVQSVGLDISNPVVSRVPGRPWVEGKAQGRVYAGSGPHPCQVEAALAMIAVLRKAFPGITADHANEICWRGDIRPDSPGVWAHANVSRVKVDPWGFPLERIAEVQRVAG